MSGGYLQPLPHLGLTGIKGSIAPSPGPARRGAQAAGHRLRGQLRRLARGAVDGLRPGEASA